GVFCALGMEGIALHQYRRAPAAQAQTASNGFQAAHRWAPVTGAATIVSGAYLAQTVWGWRAAWINTALGCALLVALISAVTASPQLARMRSGAQPHDSTLWTSFAMRTGLLVGILFLMSVKPPLDISLSAAAIATVAGFLANLRPFRSRNATVTAR
ncbi:MAG: hypothetical protein ACRD2I_26605, partial [Vicinamibacterales bacterium]